jgi:hypothetical protein
MDKELCPLDSKGGRKHNHFLTRIQWRFQTSGAFDQLVVHKHFYLLTNRILLGTETSPYLWVLLLQMYKHFLYRISM